MEQGNTVLKEPKVLKVDGSKGTYKASDYCDLKELCCGKCAGKPLDVWVEQVKGRKVTGAVASEE